MTSTFKLAPLALLLSLAAASAAGQTVPPNASLDPARSIVAPRLVGSWHRPLPEQYIWTANDASLTPESRKLVRSKEGKTEPRFFRSSFVLRTVPRQATLYIAGPRRARVFLNGKLAADLQCERGHHMVFRTLVAQIAPALRVGQNTIAIEAVRGYGSNHHTNSPLVMQLTTGEVLTAKIVPAEEGVHARPLLISNATWRSTVKAAPGWEAPEFDDSSWPRVQSLGSIEGNIDLFQWNGDPGLYRWPGYIGEAPYLANYELRPTHVKVLDDPNGTLQNIDTLTKNSAATGQKPLMVRSNKGTAGAMGTQVSAEQHGANLGHLTAPLPGILLDFGRELNGRVLLQSASNRSVQVTLQYGESLDELHKGPFLGINTLTIPARGIARGPKSAFRYALVRFPTEPQVREATVPQVGGANLGAVAIKKIVAEGIYYPVKYKGSFESSDPVVNRIWEVGAYTTHLCMQDSIWDGAKRDRGRWMGDMDVIDRVIADVFHDFKLTRDALEQQLGPAPIQHHVNGLPGYSSLWFLSESEYYRRTGDRRQLQSMHARMLQLLEVMDKELDDRAIFAANSGGKPFVDWSKGFTRNSPEARRAMQFQYLLAYRLAVWMLQELGDAKEASRWNARADQMADAAARYLAEPSLDGSFGNRWQTNAMAILAGVADNNRQQAIWSQVLQRTIGERLPEDLITPYYGYYLLSAMARISHRQEALTWMRQYWGGMLELGATSFWEAYHPDWPKTNPHSALEASDNVGYYVSLAHGWSGGPTAWLMEEVLGVQPASPGYRRVSIRPDLAGLAWAKGTVPTPLGNIRVNLESAYRTVIELPAGAQADVLLAAPSANSRVTINKAAVRADSAENGSRLRVTLRNPGRYVLEVK